MKLEKINNMFSGATLIVSSPWIMLIVGIALYIIVYCGVITDPMWKDIAMKAADILIIGVILGYFTNITTMFGIFKKDLRDIVYMEEHLKKRNDLEELWNTISKQMFANKFPVIHTQFLQAIKDYFPNDVSYYNDYKSFTKVEWEDKEHHIVKVTDNISFELVAESKDKKIIYPMRTWTRVNENDRYEERLIKFSADGVDRAISEAEETIDLGDKCVKREFVLEGRDKYEIRYIRQKIYNIDTDYYIGFRTKYIVNNLNVTLSLPEDINAIFTSRGTQHDFEDDINPDCISKIYKGIIFPRQGYIFALRINKKN